MKKNHSEKLSKSKTKDNKNITGNSNVTSSHKHHHGSKKSSPTKSARDSHHHEKKKKKLSHKKSKSKHTKESSSKPSSKIQSSPLKSKNNEKSESVHKKSKEKEKKKKKKEKERERKHKSSSSSPKKPTTNKDRQPVSLDDGYYRIPTVVNECDSAFARAKRYLESLKSDNSHVITAHEQNCNKTCTIYEVNIDLVQHRLELMMTELMHRKYFVWAESKAYKNNLLQKDSNLPIGKFLKRYDKKFHERQQRLKQENIDIKNKLLSMTSSLLLSSIDPKYLNIEPGTDLCKPSASVLPISPHLTASRTAYDLNAVGMSFRAFPSTFQPTLPVKPPEDKTKVSVDNVGKKSAKRGKNPRNKRKTAKQRKLEQITQIEIEKYLAFANKRYRKMLKYVDKLVFTPDNKQYELLQNYLKQSIDVRTLTKRLTNEKFHLSEMMEKLQLKIEDDESKSKEKIKSPLKRSRRNSTKGSNEDLLQLSDHSSKKRKSSKSSKQLKSESSDKSSVIMKLTQQMIAPSKQQLHFEKATEISVSEPCENLLRKNISDEVNLPSCLEKLSLIKDVDSDVKARKTFFKMFEEYQKYYGKEFFELFAKDRSKKSSTKIVADDSPEVSLIDEPASPNTEIDLELSELFESDFCLNDTVESVDDRLNKLYKSIDCDPVFEKQKLSKYKPSQKCERKLRSSDSLEVSPPEVVPPEDDNDDDNDNDDSESDDIIEEEYFVNQDYLTIDSDMESEDLDEEEEEEEDTFMTHFTLFDEDDSEDEDIVSTNLKFSSKAIDYVFNHTTSTKEKIFNFNEKEMNLFEKCNDDLLKPVYDIYENDDDNDDEDEDITTSKSKNSSDEETEPVKTQENIDVVEPNIDADNNDGVQFKSKVVQLIELLLKNLRPLEEQNRIKIKNLSALTRKELKLQEMESKLLSMDFEVVDYYHQYLNKNRRYTKKERRSFLKKICNRRKYSKKTIKLLLKVVTRSNITKDLFANYIQANNQPVTLKEFFEQTTNYCPTPNCDCGALKKWINNSDYDLGEILL